MMNTKKLFNMNKGLFIDLSQISANRPIEVRNTRKDCIIQVTEGLFVSGIQAANNLDSLRRKGITVIINLVSSFQQNQFENDFNYISYNIRDNCHTSIKKELQELANKIKFHIENGDKVLVHCKKGISRSPSIAIGYLIKYGGMNFDSAIAHIQEKDDRISPNVGFLLQLKTL